MPNTSCSARTTQHSRSVRLMTLGYAALESIVTPLAVIHPQTSTRGTSGLPNVQIGTEIPTDDECKKLNLRNNLLYDALNYVVGKGHVKYLKSMKWSRIC